MHGFPDISKCHPANGLYTSGINLRNTDRLVVIQAQVVCAKRGLLRQVVVQHSQLCNRIEVSMSGTGGNVTGSRTFTGLLGSIPRSVPSPLSSAVGFPPARPRHAAAVLLTAASISFRCSRAVRTIARVPTSRRPLRIQCASGGHGLVQSDRWQCQVCIAGFHEVPQWPAHKDPRHVVRIVFDNQASFCPSIVDEDVGFHMVYLNDLKQTGGATV